MLWKARNCCCERKTAVFLDIISIVYSKEERGSVCILSLLPRLEKQEKTSAQLAENSLLASRKTLPSQQKNFQQPAENPLPAS